VSAAEPDPAILAEPDHLQRARNCLAQVGRLAGALDALPEQEQRFAAMDGREARVARAQHDHLRLAEVSAQIAIAEQLTAIRALLAERLPDPYWAERDEVMPAEPSYRDPHEPPGAAQDWRG
jgi:hypothetical protein